MSDSKLGSIKANNPVFDFILNQARYKKANWGLAFAMFIPVVQYWLLLFFADESYANGGYHIWYYRIYFRVTLFFLVSLVALLIGTGIFRDLLSDDTIVYLFTKPIKRQRIYFEAFAAYLIIVVVVVTPGIAVFHWFADILIRIYDDQFSITVIESLYNFGLEILGAYIVLFGLGAIFVATGLGLKRPLLVNLLIAFGIIVEAFLLDLIANNYEPVYIASNIVAKEVVGFAGNMETDTAIYRFSLGPGIEPLSTFINFMVIFLASLYLGYWVSKRKQLL